MNIEYTLHGIHFEWDSQKALAHLQKHGVSFESAYRDPFAEPFDEVVNDEVHGAVIGLTVN